MNFLAIAHSKRTETVPHFFHQSSLTSLLKPCETFNLWDWHSFDIGKSRQTLTEAFLNVPEATHLLFIDDDIAIPNQKSLIGMFDFLEQYGESIVSGLYFDKTPPHYPVLLSLIEDEKHLTVDFICKNNNPPINKVLQVGAVALGFCLIKREVFEKIDSPWFVYNDSELLKKHVGEFLGEDMYFSLKARKAGYKLWVDTRADLLHYVPNWVGRKSTVESMTTGRDNMTVQLVNIRSGFLEKLNVQDKSD